MGLLIDKKTSEDKLIVSLTGRLDTVTAPDLEKELNDISSINSIIIDMTNLEYISSAGLRIILKMQKALKGNLTLINVKPLVKEVFDITGFSEFLNIQ